MISPKAVLQSVQKTNVDGLLMLACFGLLILGFLMVVSASLHLGVKLANDISHYPFKQLLHILLGLGFAAGILKVPMSAWQKHGQILFILGL